jgi:hypothetical protein
MKDELRNELIRAIEVLAKQITQGVSSIEALQYTQAACNMSNTIIGLSNLNETSD